MLCVKISWKFAQWFWRMFLHICQYSFRNFIIIPSWKMTWLSVWTNWNSHNPRMHFTNFGWNRSSGSGKEDFKVLSLHFPYVIISPWKGAWSFLWINLNHYHPRDALCQVRQKLPLWFWRRRLLNFEKKNCFLFTIL